MKLKNILYRNYNSLSDNEREYYKENREKFEINVCDMYHTIHFSNDLIWDCEHLGNSALCEDAYNELTN